MEEKDVKFTKKKVDESWKEGIAKERDKKAAQEQSQAKETGEKKKVTTSPESQKKFMNFLMGIATQALYLMGAIEGGPGKDLEGAQEMIEILQLLKERTEGNLSDQENQAFEKVLYDLQMRYVHASQEEAPQPPPAP